MAPSRPARMTSWVTTSRSIIPLPIVLATWVPRTKAATKLKNAAQATAFWGDRTRVDTTVAMEFAASWKPFRKSNERATRMMKTTSAVPVVRGAPSGVLDDDVADDVGVVLELVAGVLEPVVDLLPLHDLEGIAPIAPEQVGDDGVVEDVGLVLEVGDAHDGLVDLQLVGLVPDQLRDALDLDRHLDQDPGELAQPVGGRSQLEVDQVLGHPFEIVQDVVEVGGEGADVIAVEGSDEAGVEGVEDLPGEVVALVLDVAELGHLDPPRLEVGKMGELGEAAGRPEEVRGVAVEELVKPLLLRHEPSDEGIDPGHLAPSLAADVTDLGLSCDTAG